MTAASDQSIKIYTFHYNGLRVQIFADKPRDMFYDIRKQGKPFNWTARSAVTVSRLFITETLCSPVKQSFPVYWSYRCLKNVIHQIDSENE